MMLNINREIKRMNFIEKYYISLLECLRLQIIKKYLLIFFNYLALFLIKKMNLDLSIFVTSSKFYNIYFLFFGFDRMMLVFRFISCILDITLQDH